MDKDKLYREFQHRFYRAWKALEFRRGGDISETVFGQMLGKVGGKRVGQSTVNDWRNERMPRWEEMIYIAKLLDVSPGWLAFGEGPGPDSPMVRAQRPVPEPKKSNNH